MATPPHESVIAPLEYAKSHQAKHLAELMELLRIPSISTQREYDARTEWAAKWLAQAMIGTGLENIQLIRSSRHPLVYGEWLKAGPEAPTVLIYGHYDVQPADPLDEWRTPPFEPTIQDDYLYGRGASDDKAQIYIHLKAVEAYLMAAGRLPINVKFLIEGEEESGSDGFTAYLASNPQQLAADIALVSDSGMLAPDQPAIVYGLRGMSFVLLDITGPAQDLHSGRYGGGVDNPLNVLSRIIAKLTDGQGRILIPGFYDKVRPLSPAERELLAQRPFDEDVWLEETGAPLAWGEPEYPLIERLSTRPTLDVHGIIGGYTGQGAKTVLPSTAHAKISMRLVPNQDPFEVADLFAKYVQGIAPPTVRVNVTKLHFSHPVVVDWQVPAISAASDAFAQVFGRRPVFIRAGGSIPVVGPFKSDLGLETVLMGFGLPGDRVHSPNERFYLPNYFQGIQTVIHFFAAYAELSRAPG